MNGQRGMTLIELVISIVIIGVASAGLFTALAAIGGRSADPLLRQQSLAIAEAYLEEILLQPFLDPATGSQCPAAPASRAAFDNVCDYAGLDDEGARSASGAVIAALSGYRVQVSVEAQAWNGLPASDVLVIGVTVSDPAGQPLQLSGYRARY